MNNLMIDYCMAHVGLPYRWGGDDPILGYDCSGFAQEFLYAFGAHPSPGVDLTANALHKMLKANGATAEILVGSLAFYGRSLDAITHVAVVISPSLIFEFGGGGSRTIDLNAATAQNAYGRIRPLRRRADLLAVLFPRGLK